MEKFIPEQATKEDVYLYSFFNLGSRWGVGGQRHAPAALPPEKTGYTLYRRMGELQGRSGRMRKISLPTVPRSPDRPARSESLYWLSYL